jgi:hypothetical protein
MSGDGSKSRFDDVAWDEESNDGGEDEGGPSEKRITIVVGVFALILLAFLLGTLLVEPDSGQSDATASTPDTEPLVSVAVVNDDTVEVSWRPTTGSWTIWFVVQSVDGPVEERQMATSDDGTSEHSFSNLPEGEYRVYGWFDAETGYHEFDEYVVVTETTPTVSSDRVTPPATPTVTPTPTEGGGPGFGPVAALLALVTFALARRGVAR